MHGLSASNTERNTCTMWLGLGNDRIFRISLWSTVSHPLWRHSAGYDVSRSNSPTSCQLSSRYYIFVCDVQNRWMRRPSRRHLRGPAHQRHLITDRTPDKSSDHTRCPILARNIQAPHPPCALSVAQHTPPPGTQFYFHFAKIQYFFP